MNIANNIPSHVPAETTGKTQYGEDSNHILVDAKLINAQPGIYAMLCTRRARCLRTEGLRRRGRVEVGMRMKLPVTKDVFDYIRKVQAGIGNTIQRYYDISMSSSEPDSCRKVEHKIKSMGRYAGFYPNVNSLTCLFYPVSLCIH